MTIPVDFVQGVDALAPGLNRAQAPLLDALRLDRELDLLPVRFPSLPNAALFPFLYGPYPLRMALPQRGIAHIANAWYAHVVPLVHRPCIVTCHDLIQLDDLRRPETSWKAHRRFHLRAAYRGMLAARLVVCDSRAVACRLARQAPQLKERLRVVHLGISPSFSPGRPDVDRLAALGVRGLYVLYVGSEQERKNLVRLVQAVQEVRERGTELHFVKVGGHQTAQGRAALVEELDRTGMRAKTRILESVADNDLINLYRGAAVTVLPSLQEGFGFPPLEAMACGCPVVVSDRDSLPEITGGQALLVDPLDVRSMAEAILRVTSDPVVAARMRARGPVQASSFTWERAAEEYAALYREAAL